MTPLPSGPLTLRYDCALGAITVETLPHGDGDNGSRKKTKKAAGSVNKEHISSGYGKFFELCDKCRIIAGTFYCWYVHVASAFPLAYHHRAVLAWGLPLAVDP